MYDINKILTVIKQECSNEERTEFYKKLESDEVLRELYYEQKNAWVKTGLKPVLTEEEKNKDFQELWNKLNGMNRTFILGRWSQYAAIFMIAAMIGAIVNHLFETTGAENDNPMFTFSSGRQSIANVELPDGSLVSLNANSNITYQLDYDSNERLVTLAGEALFEVEHDETSPFIIDFNDLKIVDLGTMFSVKAFSGAETIETTLFEGALELRLGEDRRTPVLPGESYTYYTNHKTVEKQGKQHSNPLAWQKNRFEYKGEKLEKIMQDLSHWYSFEVKWQSDQYKNKQYLLNIEKPAHVESILDLITAGTALQFKLEKENSVIKRVIIK